VVDLERLRLDATYARAELAALEDAADDETLLVLVLRVREKLFPAPKPEPASRPRVQEPQPVVPLAAPRFEQTRSYTTGARGF
jgi:hypothetical protein